MSEMRSSLPFTFREFVREPVKAMLLLVTLALAYMYIENKISYTSQIKAQGKKIEILEAKVDVLTNQLRKSDSTLSAAAAKIGLLQELGKIK